MGRGKSPATEKSKAKQNHNDKRGRGSEQASNNTRYIQVNRQKIIVNTGKTVQSQTQENNKHGRKCSELSATAKQDCVCVCVFSIISLWDEDCAWLSYFFSSVEDQERRPGDLGCILSRILY